MNVRKALLAIAAVIRDPSLLHLALHASRGETWPLGKVVAAHVPSDDRWRLGASLAVEGEVSATSKPDGLLGIETVGDRYVVKFAHDGTTWSIPTGDEILRSMLTTGRYEGPELDALLAWVRQRPELDRRSVVIDVGANVGTTTVPIAQNGRCVVAIEPVPETASLLRANVTDNGLADVVTCLEVAVSTHGGPVDMVVGPGLGTSEVDTGHRVHPGHEAGLVTVASCGLETMLTEAGHAPGDVAFVWSDTQGCEADVIATGRAIWQTGSPLYTEFCPSALDLHGGLDRFLALAAAEFTSFVPNDDLLRDGSRSLLRPIAELGSFARAMPADASTDVLLVPAAPGAQ